MVSTDSSVLKIQTEGKIVGMVSREEFLRRGCIPLYQDELQQAKSPEYSMYTLSFASYCHQGISICLLESPARTQNNERYNNLQYFNNNNNNNKTTHMKNKIKKKIPCWTSQLAVPLQMQEHR